MTNRMKALGAVFAAASLMMGTSAHADGKCRAAVSKASAALTQAIAKNLQKCEQAVHDGKLTGPCSSEPGTQAKITKAKDKLRDAIAKACATSTGEFAFGRCPNETGTTGSNCGNLLINTKADEAECLVCLADHNAKELVSRVLYSSLVAPGTKDIGKCQAAIGKNTVAFYTTESKSLSKCQASLIKGKIDACPDSKTTAAIDKAEQKKKDAIAKACCGDDGVCGGAVCSASAPNVACQGGANDQKACTADSDCPGGACHGAGNESRCVGGSNGGLPCLVAGDCPGGTCHSGQAACEAASDCGRCQGSTSPGKPCRANGQCDQDPGNCNTSLHKCVGGSNPGTACTLPGGAECLGGTCSAGVCTGGTNNGNVCTVNGDCPSVPAGTCVGLTGLCGGSDDFNPVTDVGWISPTCPGITTGGAAIALTGVTGNTIITCADAHADKRAQCQDAAGATFNYDGDVPPFCVDTPTDCTPTGPTHTATVQIHTGGADLAGVSINLGYKTVNFPGTGENDNDDSMTLSVTDLGTPITDGENLFVVTFGDCGAAPTAANFGCVVRSASDSSGTDIQDGISCTVTVP